MAVSTDPEKESGSKPKESSGVSQAVMIQRMADLETFAKTRRYTPYIWEEDTHVSKRTNRENRWAAMDRMAEDIRLAMQRDIVSLNPAVIDRWPRRFRLPRGIADNDVRFFHLHDVSIDTGNTGIKPIHPDRLCFYTANEMTMAQIEYRNRDRICWRTIGIEPK